MSELSFTGRLQITGEALPCNLGFQYIKNGTESLKTQYGSTTKYTVGLPKEEYLCANCCLGSESPLLYFLYSGRDFIYHIASREPGSYNGYWLGRTSTRYIGLYQSSNERSDFAFFQNGQFIHPAQLAGNTFTNLELNSADGNLQLHKKVYADYTGNNQWAAYTCTMGGDAGYIGPNVTLQIVERNV
ncbi:hypothetical protein [Pseudomonas frederiksbergensis]|uniref:hypothetical protein n=1 Tax=Pseudomonas frederiksbergensis TaxID=104087 RepID=UPI0011CDCAB2|nr:hypothetical protein [Pseudomonas frederiksbergensis]